MLSSFLYANLPDPENYDAQKGYDAIDNLGPQDIKDLMITLHQMAGREVPRNIIYTMDHPEQRHMTAYDAMMDGIITDIDHSFEQKLPGDLAVAVDRRDSTGCTFALAYDPKEWYPRGQEVYEWVFSPSARLFTLAYLGILEAAGFVVSGTNLPRSEKP
jgi:hypothetical protein